MIRNKRRYIPKTRGCYECSQRRINCDRGEPSCAKCIAKDIPCSGLGIRFRFTEDVVAKCRTGEKRKSGGPYQPNVTCDDRTVELRSGNPTLSLRDYDHDPVCPDIDYEISVSQAVSSPTFPTCSATDLTDAAHDDAANPSEQILLALNSRYSWSCTARPIPQALNDASNPWKRHLLLHFANNIAPELVVIDDHQNGWRYLVLPIAGLDNLVMDAVLSASAFHFSANVNDQLYKPSTIYAKTIQKLQERQNLDAQDMVGKQTVLLALLVLLAVVMVNGCSDFPTVFNLLESAVRAMGGEEASMQGELGHFLVRQIRKYRGYAAPLLGQAEGIARLSLTASFGPDTPNGWDCFKFYYQSHPEFSQSMSILYELNRQACDIYVARALAGPEGPPMIEMVETFIDTMQSYPTDCPGEHVLVFATFLVAAESVLPEHQEYFVGALMKHYRRNGFSNIPLAMDHLRRIWSNRDEKDWTQLLPELQIFVV